MGKIGLGFLGEPRVQDAVNIARRAEGLGFDSFWWSETRFTRDAITPLAAIAAATSRARLGSAAVNVYTRGVVLTAVTFASLDEMSNGRIILGVGPGSPKILERQGFEFHGALKRLVEYVQAFRLLIKGGPVDYSGEYVKLRGVSLDFTPPRKEIPVYLAVTGPKALLLAGKIANGVILNGFTSATYAKRAIETIREGAQSAGRKLEDLDISSANITSMSDDGEAAKEALRSLVATYLVTFPAIAKESGVSDEFLESVRLAHASKGLDYASKLVPHSVIEALTTSGDPDHCIRRLREYISSGVKRPIVMPIASDPKLVMKTMLKV